MEILKQYIKDKYTAIALRNSITDSESCCTGGCCSSQPDATAFSESYSHIAGYTPAADFGLGCGLPTEFADIAKGNTVLDLGSGAGNDCFVARALVGDEGYVAGIDFTSAMVNKARANATAMGYTNVDFIESDIEKIPVNSSVVDVMISNCVLNLVPDKEKVIAEIYRVLKHGGHFCISDVVIEGNLPVELKGDAAMYAGCVAGALQREEFLNLIKGACFQDIEIKKEKKIELPDDLLLTYMSDNKLQKFKTSKTGIYSITVVAYKPQGCRCGL